MGRWSVRTVDVRADGTGLCSRAGTSLLALAADRLGLTGGLSAALAGTRERLGGHDPGRVFCDLAVMLADGGRCVSDLAALAGQESLFGEVASVSTARRVVRSIGSLELTAVRAARARARARAWAAGAAPERVILDFDATPIVVHSEKDQAAGHYKGGFGFNPLIAACGREIIAGILRPGNAGANNAEDHLALLDLALEQLPAQALDGEILARSDSAGASHDLADACRECDIRFSFGYPLTEPVRQALLGLAESAWQPGIDQDGQPRDGAWVSELSGRVTLPDWPEGTRLICRRERPHPGAQLSFSDLNGHRFQCFITDQTDPDLAQLEALHRQHAVVEDRVKTLKATGASYLPFHSFDANAAWFELALCAHDVMVWTQLLCLEDEHRICEPKRLRYRILHVAGHLTRHARRHTLHLPADWPWAHAILHAFSRLRALSAPG
ncbi:MAG TPA: IS1380 family transposase [Candidatus Limnocylindrales bacterium]|nr:IS1380 family transposase [Candidatus Limnocylindrales bacterium]